MKNQQIPRQTTGCFPFMALLGLAAVVWLAFGAPACVDSGGQGGYVAYVSPVPPAAANLFAQATQTAAIANATATQNQAMNYQAATTSAIQATNTTIAATTTSQAAATTTSEHILVVVEADITRDYAAIIQEREDAASTATAIALNRQIQADAQEALRQQERATFNAGFWRVLKIVVSTLLIVALAGGLLLAWRWAQPVIRDQNGNPVAISRKYEQLRRPVTIDTVALPPAAPAVAPDRTVSLNGTNTHLHEAPVVLEYARQKVTFNQRQIGRLRQWVRDGDYGLRRDTSPEGHGFQEIGIKSNAYSQTLAVLQGKGYVSKDAPHRWTDRGLTEFLGLTLENNQTPLARRRHRRLLHNGDDEVEEGGVGE